MKFSLGIAHNGGIIRDMKWFPGLKYNGTQSSLGVLAAACSDGAIRVFVLVDIN